MELRHQITIRAPREAVWTVSVNVPDWPTWTPTVRTARALSKGGFGVGSRYALKQPLQRETVWEVTACRPGESFTWETRDARQLMRAAHCLESNGAETLNTLVLEAPEVRGAIRERIASYFISLALARENAGLKAFCEQQGR